MTDQTPPPDDRFTPGQRWFIKSVLVILLLLAELAFGLLNMWVARVFFGPGFLTSYGLFGLVAFMVTFRLLGPSPKGYAQSTSQRLNGAAIRGICAFVAAFIMNRLYP
jgi:hypothetical protein